jgi:hypothetical protein
MSRSRTFDSRSVALTVLASAALIAGCSVSVQRSDPDSADALDVVRAQFEAFNDHDVEALTARIAPDFTWWSVSGDSTVLEVRGRDDFRDGMSDYFASLPSVQSSIEGATVTGAYVAVRERVRWSTAEGSRSQEALAVYEVRNGLIRRVWYYPAQR